MEGDAVIVAVIGVDAGEMRFPAGEAGLRAPRDVGDASLEYGRGVEFFPDRLDGVGV